MLDDTYFMKQALSEAKKAYDKGEVPIGAVVVCNQQVIARAHNLTETLNDATAHAEMQVITSAANYLGSKYLIDCILCHYRALCNVCGSVFLVKGFKSCIWWKRRERRLYEKSSIRNASKNGSCGGNSGR